MHPGGVSELYLGQVKGPRIDLATDAVMRTAARRSTPRPPGSTGSSRATCSGRGTSPPSARTCAPTPREARECRLMTGSPFLALPGAVAAEASTPASPPTTATRSRAARARARRGDRRPLAPRRRHGHRARPAQLARLDHQPGAREPAARGVGTRPSARPDGRIEYAAHVIDDGVTTGCSRGRRGRAARAGSTDEVHAPGRGRRPQRARSRSSAPCRSPRSTRPAGRRPERHPARLGRPVGRSRARRPPVCARRRATRQPTGAGARRSCRAPRSPTRPQPCAPARVAARAARRRGAAHRRLAAAVRHRGRREDDPARAGLAAQRRAPVKGCYRGQETVAKVHNLGHPPRRLVMLHLDGSDTVLPAPGDEVVGERCAPTATARRPSEGRRAHHDGARCTTSSARSRSPS